MTDADIDRWLFMWRVRTVLRSIWFLFPWILRQFFYKSVTEEQLCERLVRPVPWQGKELLSSMLLHSYPNARGLLDAVEKHDGWGEAFILDEPHVLLLAHGDHEGARGPFWTLIRNDGERHYWFHIISISLDPSCLSICVRRRNYGTGVGGTFQGDEAKQKFISNDFVNLVGIYQGYFIDDRALQQERERGDGKWWAQS